MEPTVFYDVQDSMAIARWVEWGWVGVSLRTAWAASGRRFGRLHGSGAACFPAAAPVHLPPPLLCRQG